MELLGALLQLIFGPLLKRLDEHRNRRFREVERAREEARDASPRKDSPPGDA